MITVQRWTGVETRALRTAYLMPVRQFADLVGVSASTVSDWENKGHKARLRPSTQQLLDRVLAKAPAAVGARFNPVGAGTTVAEVDPHGSRQADLVADADVLDDPDEIEGRRTRLASLTLDEAKLGYLERAAFEAIAENERQPPLKLAPRVRRIRLHVEELIRAAQHPPQRARLYAVATHLSGLLGVLALDLGRSALARAYAREAFDLADAADRADLRAWARATQSLVEYYGNNYYDALAYARDGQRFAAGGPHAVRLAINGEARALARTGDRHGVDEAVARGMQLLDGHDPAAGVSPSLAVGVYCTTRAAANAATAYLAVGVASRAEEFAVLALPAFDEARMLGPQALTRLDLATAALMNDSAEPERACQMVKEAIMITDREQFGSVEQRAREFVSKSERWSGTAAMREVVELVGARTAAARLLAGSVGA